LDTVPLGFVNVPSDEIGVGEEDAKSNDCENKIDF
jgi:hypothetical protein